MIPKIIHYCWFGKGKLSSLQKICVSTWYEKLPDYKIILWNEENIKKNEYVDYHLNKKNWAFVADYIRLKALQDYGGIYLDVDVEVVKSFDDLLNNNVFLGEELPGRLNNAILGATKGSNYIEECRKYVIERFESRKPQMLSPEVSTHIYNKCFNKDKDIKIYPPSFFYPYNPYSENENLHQLMACFIKEDTYAIHHWGKSWEIGVFEKVKRKLFRIS